MSSPQGNPIEKKDIAGKVSFNTIFGDKVTVERHADIEEQFPANINTVSLTTELVDTGTVTVENDMLKVSSGSGTAAEAHLETKKVIRYRPGFEAFAFFTALFESNPTGCIQRIGPLTSTDGYYLGFGTDGIFEVGRINNSTVVPIKQSAFNGDKRFSEIDLTKINVWGIHYGWLGSAPIFYSVMLPNGEWIVFHTERITGKLTIPHSANPQLPIHVEVVKTSGATDVIVRSGSLNGGINGSDLGAGDRFISASESKTLGVATEAAIMSLRVVSTFQSKTNRVLVELIKRILISDGNKAVTFRIYRNLSIATPTWLDLDATNSVIQIDTAGTPTFAASKQVDIVTIGKADFDIEKLKDEGFIFYPGDTLTISAESANASDTEASVRFVEHH